jgi:hypothetical protein
MTKEKSQLKMDQDEEKEFLKQLEKDMANDSKTKPKVSVSSISTEKHPDQKRAATGLKESVESPAKDAEEKESIELALSPSDKHISEHKDKVEALTDALPMQNLALQPHRPINERTEISDIDN